MIVSAAHGQAWEFGKAAQSVTGRVGMVVGFKLVRPVGMIVRAVFALVLVIVFVRFARMGMLVRVMVLMPMFVYVLMFMRVRGRAVLMLMLVNMGVFMLVFVGMLVFPFHLALQWSTLLRSMLPPPADIVLRLGPNRMLM